MKTLVVLAHPEPRSFCAALSQRAVLRMKSEGEVRLIDLYAQNFDPVIRASHFPVRASAERFEPMVEQAHQAATGVVTSDVAAHQEALRWCNRMLLVFPLWWWGMPAILKGWVDRALSTDFAYGTADLSGRTAMLCVTAETKAERFEPTGGDNPLYHIERGILKFCGFEVAQSFIAANIYDLSAAARASILEDFEASLARHLTFEDARCSRA